MYAKCPKMYWERYEADQKDVQRPGDGAGPQEVSGGPKQDAVGPLVVLGQSAKGIELDEPSEGRDFGTRMHQLLHERRLRGMGRQLDKLQISPEWPDEDIESEAQATLAAYEAHYVRDLEYLESERTHTLDLPDRCPTCWHAGVRDPSLADDQ